MLVAALLAVPVAVKLMGSGTLYRAQPLNRKELRRRRTALQERLPEADPDTQKPTAPAPPQLPVPGEGRRGREATRSSRTVAEGTQSRHNRENVQNSAEAAS